MKIAALLSGGKDSCYNMLECVKRGHEITVLVNLLPENSSINELDSYMYQTIGHTAIEAIAEAMQVPLIRWRIKGKSLELGMSYNSVEGDEVEDLYNALKETQRQYPEIEAVSSGAILSNYQRVRVENVCNRLGLQSIALLWEREQCSLLQSMIDDGIVAIVIKTATMGLDRRHIGKSLNELQPYLLKIKKMYGCNPCGEGGEYETFTIDCPLFKKRIEITESEIMVHTEDKDAPILLYVPKAWRLVEKEAMYYEYGNMQYQSVQEVVVRIKETVPEEAGHVLTLSVVCNQTEIIWDLLREVKKWYKREPVLEYSIQDVDICRIWATSEAGQTQTWYSLSLWCPPAAAFYSLVWRNPLLYAFPMISSVYSDSLLPMSQHDAISCCLEYEEKMRSTLPRQAKPLLTIVSINDSTSLQLADIKGCNTNMIIAGYQKDCLMRCAIEMKSIGYLGEENCTELSKNGDVNYWSCQCNSGMIVSVAMKSCEIDACSEFIYRTDVYYDSLYSIKEKKNCVYHPVTSLAMKWKNEEWKPCLDMFVS